jgi:hypothetical protein
MSNASMAVDSLADAAEIRRTARLLVPLAVWHALANAAAEIAAWHARRRRAGQTAAALSSPSRGFEPREIEQAGATTYRR